MADTAPEPPYDGYLDETRVPIVIGYTTFCLSVAFIAICLRVYSRAVVLKQFGPDDWASLVAFSLVFATGFCVSFNIEYGFGKHFMLMTPDKRWRYLRTFYTSIVFYNATLLAIKVTFLLQFYRVFSTRKMRRIILAVGLVVVGWGISQVLVEMFICTPIEKFWMGDAVDGRCIPNYPQWYINAGGNIMTDIAVFLIPLPTIWKLNLQRSQRIILLGIFCLGFFTCAISILRIQFLQLSEDATWDNVESAGWSVGELCSGLICSCLPTMRPLLHKWVPSLSTKSTPNAKGYYYGRSNPNGSLGSGGPLSGHGHHHSIKPATRRTGSGDGLGSCSGDSGTNREKFYHMPDLERQDSDEQFIMHEMHAPATTVQPRHGTTEPDAADEANAGRMTGVRTEIMSGGTPPRFGQRRMNEGAIRIERDIVQTESKCR